MENKIPENAKFKVGDRVFDEKKGISGTIVKITNFRKIDYLFKPDQPSSYFLRSDEMSIIPKCKECHYELSFSESYNPDLICGHCESRANHTRLYEKKKEDLADKKYGYMG